MRADFYLINQAQLPACLPTLCRILAKAYSAQQSVFVLTQDVAQTQTLDELLWTFRDDSFIPHAVLAPNTEHATPIGISHQPNLFHQQDIFVNLTTQSLQAIDLHPLPTRLIKLIPQHDETYKQHARLEYQQLKQAGYELHRHTLG
ncbi:MAG: hypothetical protein GKR77_02580 [Legionellales bacterium]|nr:hypothetical protein [Legionellales bacterium]